MRYARRRPAGTGNPRQPAPGTAGQVLRRPIPPTLPIVPQRQRSGERRRPPPAQETAGGPMGAAPAPGHPVGRRLGAPRHRRGGARGRTLGRAFGGTRPAAPSAGPSGGHLAGRGRPGLRQDPRARLRPDPAGRAFGRTRPAPAAQAGPGRNRPPEPGPRGKPAPGDPGAGFRSGRRRWPDPRPFSASPRFGPSSPLLAGLPAPAAPPSQAQDAAQEAGQAHHDDTDGHGRSLPPQPIPRRGRPVPGPPPALGPPPRPPALPRPGATGAGSSPPGPGR